MVLFQIGFTGVALLTLTGCASQPHQPQRTTGDAVGRTYYIDGAGNWGYGVLEVAEGLRHAGYRGNVINYRWSPTLNPALDQTVGRPMARLRGKALGDDINQYQQRYPGKLVNVIALSAGTGVAVWGCEAVTPPAKVANLILLGSSLSSDYDMEKAIANIDSGVWVYYSHGDQILAGPVRTMGTIDGKVGVEAAGLIGLKYHGAGSEKVHNVAWAAKYERFGWTGAHTDATSEPFVRTFLSRHIVTEANPTTNPAHVITGISSPEQSFLAADSDAMLSTY